MREVVGDDRRPAPERREFCTTGPLAFAMSEFGHERIRVRPVDRTRLKPAIPAPEPTDWYATCTPFALAYAFVQTDITGVRRRSSLRRSVTLLDRRRLAARSCNQEMRSRCRWCRCGAGAAVPPVLEDPQRQGRELPTSRLNTART